MTSCQLHITDLRLWVHLGCGEPEKTNPQLVSFDIHLLFPNTLEGLKTDNLADTFCYLKTVENIQKMVTQHQPFNLIEHLASCIYASVYHDLSALDFDNIELEIRVNKLSPPVANVHGGVSLIYKNKLEKGKKDDLYQHWF